MLKFFFLALVFISCRVVYSQVTINRIEPDSRTILEVFSEDQRDNLQNVSDGRLILNSNTNCLNYYYAGSWYSLCGFCLPETPMVVLDSILFKGGLLMVYFDEIKAREQLVDSFLIKIEPIGWVYRVDHSPFVVNIELDSTYASVSLCGIGKCGMGRMNVTDSVLIYSYHPCDDLESIVDARDNHTYELVEVGDQCWIRGYLKYIPQGSAKFLNKQEAVYYEWTDFTIQTNNLCPAGFHVPSKSEAQHFSYMMGEPYNQFSVSESYDNRLSEFAVEFTGSYDGKRELFFKGVSDFFWVQEPMNKQDAYLGMLNKKGAMVVSAPKKSFMPIRCIKD